MVQWAKDLALSLCWAGSTLRQSLVWELPYVVGAAKKKNEGFI